MEFPVWLTEARLAIIVSVTSAAFTGGSLWYTRRLALNDTARMKRKPPAFEVRTYPVREKPDWMSVDIVARNFEPVAVNITGYRHKGRQVLLVHPDQIMRDSGLGMEPCVDGLRNEMGAPAISERAGIGAGGAQETRSTAPHAMRPTEHLTIYARGPFRRDRFTVEWEWADGAPR